MTAPKPPKGMKSWLVQCSVDNFEHAAYLSAVFSEVLAVNEQALNLQVSSMNDRLRGQFERLGAAVSHHQPCQS